MHTVYIHIDEHLDHDAMRSLQGDLSQLHHVSDVEVSDKTPHDILVEFDEAHITPMAILREPGRHGLHADVVSA